MKKKNYLVGDISMALLSLLVLVAVVLFGCHAPKAAVAYSEPMWTNRISSMPLKQVSIVVTNPPMPEMAETADMPRVEERAVYAMNAVLPPRTNPTFIPKVGTALEFRPVRTNNTRYMGLTATNTTGPWTMFTNVILDAPTTNALTNAFYFFYPDDGGPQRFFQVAATNLYL